MAQRDNILQELRELQSLLANAGVQNIYHVPVRYFEQLAEQVMRRIKALEATNATEELRHLTSVFTGNTKGSVYTLPEGYFEGLAEQVLRRIKALEAKDATEELNHLSPFLSSISKENPYAVPKGYFQKLATEAGVMKDIDKNAAEELETLSPLLSRLKKEIPYSVPQGYFDSLDKAGHENIVKPAGKVVSISITKQRWFRYAAAAVVISFVAVSGLLIFKKPGSASTTEKPFAGIIDMKKVSQEEIDQFVNLIDEESPVVATTDIKKETEEIKELIKDIPEEELQQFLETTEASIADESSDDLFLN
ncbi:MAG: hypothetical protein JNN00_15710 [Chitinophagaceae bacterium]|nr:hypothetical protein [Chitinophagaceae bacterium]